jgi:hypothetical protein
VVAIEQLGETDDQVIGDRTVAARLEPDAIGNGRHADRAERCVGRDLDRRPQFKIAFYRGAHPDGRLRFHDGRGYPSFNSHHQAKLPGSMITKPPPPDLNQASRYGPSNEQGQQPNSRNAPGEPR